MAVEQLDLLGGAHPVGRQAPRQDAVLALLHAHPEGCSADECGAAVHASAGKHNTESRCAYCSVDARPVLLALIRKKLVTRTSNGQFALKTEAHPDASFGEFPEGF